MDVRQQQHGCNNPLRGVTLVSHPLCGGVLCAVLAVYSAAGKSARVASMGEPGKPYVQDGLRGFARNSCRPFRLKQGRAGRKG